MSDRSKAAVSVREAKTRFLAPAAVKTPRLCAAAAWEGDSSSLPPPERGGMSPSGSSPRATPKENRYGRRPRQEERKVGDRAGNLLGACREGSAGHRHSSGVCPASGSSRAKRDQRGGFARAHAVTCPGVAFLPENTQGGRGGEAGRASGLRKRVSARLPCQNKGQEGSTRSAVSAAPRPLLAASPGPPGPLGTAERWISPAAALEKPPGAAEGRAQPRTCPPTSTPPLFTDLNPYLAPASLI